MVGEDEFLQLAKELLLARCGKWQVAMDQKYRHHDNHHDLHHHHHHHHHHHSRRHHQDHHHADFLLQGDLNDYMI